MRDWVANYEIGDVLRCTNDPNVFFLRHIERGDVKHEERGRVAIEDALFVDHRYFFERCHGADLALLHEQRGIGRRSGSKLAALWRRRVATERAREEEPAPTWMLTCDEYDLVMHERRRLAPVIILDLLGHFVIGKPILLDGEEPCLLVYNSSPGGDQGYIARPSIDVLVQQLYARAE